MNSLEFSKDIPAETLATIFKDFFEEHMVTYNIVKDLEFAGINSVSCDKASIMYSIRLLDAADRDKVLHTLQSSAASIVMYGRTYTPNIFINGDLLCISISK
jgi:hypothetical protein